MRNGRKPPVRVDPNDARQVLLATCTRQVVGTLRHYHPLMEPEQALVIAREVGGFQIGAAQELLEAHLEKKSTHWGVTLLGKAALIGASRDGLRMEAPLRVEDCTSLDEVLKSVTVFALLHDPVVRALLQAQDYHLKFVTGDAETPQSAEAKA